MAYGRGKGFMVAFETFVAKTITETEDGLQVRYLTDGEIDEEGEARLRGE